MVFFVVIVVGLVGWYWDFIFSILDPDSSLPDLQGIPRCFLELRKKEKKRKRKREENKK